MSIATVLVKLIWLLSVAISMIRRIAASPPVAVSVSLLSIPFPFSDSVSIPIALSSVTPPSCDQLLRMLQN